MLVLNNQKIPKFIKMSIKIMKNISLLIEMITKLINKNYQGLTFTLGGAFKDSFNKE